ncbi:hydrogenase expression/formation protein HypE [archaeon SCG-AAA382B04]|nr:hydrogenase expression/formation protein HypE [archaeon SCG-AAA382B04]
MKEDIIKMEHGAGGELMEGLINSSILDNLRNNSAGGIGLEELDDGGTIPLGDRHLVFTTDSHVVKPLFFPGGNIGKLAVSGTINDLSVMGAKPLALTCSLVIEEGFSVEKLDEIISSMNEVSENSDVPIITGDTKVLAKEELDDVVINTAGIGITKQPISDCNLKEGDKLVLNGSIGDHGLSIMSFREGFTFESNLESDVQPLNKLIRECLDTGGVRAMKDPTRGGLANTLNEMASKSDKGILIEEEKIPINKGVRSAGDILGIDPLEVANEGKVVMVIENGFEDEIIEIMNNYCSNNCEPAVIGEVIDEEKGNVVLKTEVGGKRYVEAPVGDPVPRVC